MLPSARDNHNDCANILRQEPAEGVPIPSDRQNGKVGRIFCKSRVRSSGARMGQATSNAPRVSMSAHA